MMLLRAIAFGSLLFAMQGMADAEPFTISYWWGPRIDQTNATRYGEVAAAGFTLANVPAVDFSVPIPFDEVVAGNLAILDQCQAFGMKAMIFDYRIYVALNQDPGWQAGLDGAIADYASHPALGAYYVTDEPSATQFPAIGAVVDYLRTHDPEHMAFVNLFPNYATPAQLGTATYEEHLNQFVAQAHPWVLSYDHYNFGIAGDYPGFFDNLESARAVAQANAIPLWVTTQLATFPGMRDLNEAEIRWCAMQCLAYGATGIMYFTYWCNPDPDFSYAAFEWDGTRTDHYDHLQSINAGIQTLSPYLSTLRSIQVMHFGPEADSVTPFAPAPPIRTLLGGPMTVGLFEDDCFMLVNKDYTQERTAYLQLDEGLQLQHLRKTDGQWESLGAPDQLTMIELLAGDGELFRATPAESAAGRYWTLLE
jgi:hypothetical protein